MGILKYYFLIINKMLLNYCKSLLNSVLLKFILVGSINTLVGVGLYCLFLYLGADYRLSVILSTCLGVLFNFKSIGLFVFKNSNNKLIYRFLGVYLVGYFVNIGLIRLFLTFSILNAYYAGIAATPIVAILSFFLQKKIVYIQK